MPDAIRSDRGTETVLIADAHWQLCCAQEDRAERLRPFEKCWMFGKSTANQRIEAWWMHLQSSMLHRWVLFFNIAQEEGHYQFDRLHDRLACYAVYMRLIREEAYEFMENWNTHKIRSQKNRPHTVSGKPWYLYEFPEPPAEKCASIPDLDLVEKLRAELQAYDMDEYLPPVTKEWCHQKALELGYDLDTLKASDILTTGTGQRLHGPVYMDLREAIRLHIISGAEPILTCTETPTGAGRWQPSQTAIDAFQNARRNEEPDMFQDQLDNELRLDSDDEIYLEAADSEAADSEAAGGEEAL